MAAAPGRGDRVGLLDHERVVAGPADRPGCRQARRAGADDHDMLIHRASYRPGHGDQRVTEAGARQTGAVRITVWVRPGSARPGVGGERGGALVVRVGARAVDGQATEAALAAVAVAFGLRRRAVTLVAGASSRTKIFEVEGADPAALSRLLADAGQL